MSLTIEEILAADNSQPLEVEVPQWGGTVFVRRLSALEAVKLSGAMQEIQAADQVGVRQEQLVLALAAYLCDQNGGALATIEQARSIAGKSAAAVNIVVEAGHRLNSVDPPAAQAAAKN